MRMRIRWFLLIAGLFLIPSTGFAQMDVPPVSFTGPLSHPRFEDGGLYVGFNFVYMNTNRTLASQIIAVRGFKDLDGSITGGPPGAFSGSGVTALETNQVMGPGQNQPGWDLFFGWRFEGGVAVELSWRHLVQVQYHAAAGLIPPDFNTGIFFENTFLFAPVTNFSTAWAGANPKFPTGSNAATFGIWNAASEMNISFTQRYDIYSVNARIPMWETADYRAYGLFGPRIVWIWERFDWRTVSADVNGNSAPEESAIYSNTVSNRLYGVHFGSGHDWFLGTTPIGGFAVNVDLEGGLYVDLAKTTANYNRGDGLVSSGRSGRLSSIVPSAEIRAGLKWYVWEGISIDLGYDIQTYFNTIASPKPVDFNLGTVDPQYEHYFFRWYHGFHFGISFVF
jgi:Legionella pneumophila major outer membrane protein precursor